MSAISAPSLPDYYREEILLHPENRKFPKFDLVRLLGTVFEPTQGCKVCILIDFDEPAALIKDLKQRGLFQDTLIVGATVFDGEGRRFDNASVEFRDGRMVAIHTGKVEAGAGVQVIDGTGKFVTPGIIDIHSHLGDYPSPGIQGLSDGNEATAPTTAMAACSRPDERVEPATPPSTGLRSPDSDITASVGAANRARASFSSSIRTRSRDGCFRAFRLNHWLGFGVFAGTAAAFALR